MRIALIGMMGTGKTTVGVKLAERLSLSFGDIDDIIVYKVGMPIAQAQIYFGEKTFRSYETSALLELVWHEDIVISCGGRISINEENMRLMQDYIKVRLTADPEVILKRLSADSTKPVLKDNTLAQITRLAVEREEKYASYADITVDTTNITKDQALEEIIRLIKEKGLI